MDAQTIAALCSDIGNEPVPDDGILIFAVARPGEAGQALSDRLQARVSKAGYASIQTRMRNRNNDASNTGVCVAGWRKPLLNGRKRVLDSGVSSALSDTLSRLCHDYFVSGAIQDGDNTAGRIVVLVVSAPRQIAVPRWAHRELPEELGGYVVDALIDEGLCEERLPRGWRIFALRLCRSRS